MTIDYKAFEGHTPGPFEVSDHGEAIQIYASDGGRVGFLTRLRGPFGAQGRRSGTEVRSNANLFAAAPELLSDHKRMSAEIARLREALTELVKINEDHNSAVSEIIGHPLGWKDSYLDKARTALASETQE